ncbi:MAG: transposase [Planctomycetaceae bacterium]|nr:transposase [Planctomycetaceae bacterium]
MVTSESKKLTDLTRVFLEPANSTPRQYEALRAYFVDGLPSEQAPRRFGSTPGSFRVLVPQFRQNPRRDFFRTPAKGPHAAPKADPLRDRILALRKQNLSIYDISRNFTHQGNSLSPVAVAHVLKEEGFARLPRRADDERPVGSRPTIADVADVRHLDLSPASFRTKFGGLFLVVPMLATIPLDRILRDAGFPGSQMVPAGSAMRSLLALKLSGTARHGHLMSSVLDQGLALFAGLNVIPKRSFLTEYSCRIAPACYPALMRRWFDAVSRLGLPRGRSFDLDFHTIPFHGDDALIEKHYISKRSRRQKGILAFLVPDAATRVFCSANGELRKGDQNGEILRFARFWKEGTGRYPQELIFDSKLTTYAKLDELNRLGIPFITRRRRAKGLMQEIAQTSASTWRRIERKGVSRPYTHPRILDRRISLADYEGPLRPVTVADLGHEEPTILLTNQLTATAAKLIERYARRMIIENSIEDGIDFFHMDALSSAVAMKVDCDLQLTLMASSLYRLLAGRIGRGYEQAKWRHLFRDFVDATAVVTIGESEIVIRYQKRAHNPLLVAAGLDRTETVIPWLAGKRLRLVFG